MERIFKKKVILFLFVLTIMLFCPGGKSKAGWNGIETAEAASWRITGGRLENGHMTGRKVTNGKIEYRTNGNSFYSCDTKGRNKKIIYKVGSNSTILQPDIRYFYNGKIYISFFYFADGMFGKYEGKMMVYDIAKKRYVFYKKPFYMLGASGKYLLGCGVISEAPTDDFSVREAEAMTTDPIYIYNMSNGKTKTLTKTGVDGMVSGKYFFYAHYSGKYLSIIRCKNDGSSKKVMKKIKWDCRNCSVQKFTSHLFKYLDYRTDKVYSVKY